MSLRQSATCKSYMSTCISKDPLSGLVLPKITTVYLSMKNVKKFLCFRQGLVRKELEG